MDLGVLGVVVVVLPSLSDWHRQACVQVQLDKNCFLSFLHRQLNFFHYCSPQIRPDAVQQASLPIDKHADEQVIINIIRNFLIKYINMLVLIQIINIGKIYIILTLWKSWRYFKRPTTKMCKIESYLVQCSLGDWCVTKSQLFTKILLINQSKWSLISDLWSQSRLGLFCTNWARIWTDLSSSIS